MGCRRTLATLFLIGLTAAAAPPISEALWIAPARRVIALTREPRECLRVPVNREDAKLAFIGRAAFRAPLLLGGQAARAGLSCASCHRNGHGNPDFRFPGLSGADGTADVTSSLMSSSRGNGIFDPKPIPDLARDPPKISRDPKKPDLRNFIHGLVTEEFDGVEPPTRVLDGLTLYVRSLGGASCSATAVQAITLASLFNDARAAVGSAQDAWKVGDAETARLLVGAARSTLRRIDERFAGPIFATSRARIARSDQALFEIQRVIDARAATMDGLVHALLGQTTIDEAYLHRLDTMSRFNPAVLSLSGKNAKP